VKEAAAAQLSISGSSGVKEAAAAQQSTSAPLEQSVCDANPQIQNWQSHSELTESLTVSNGAAETDFLEQLQTGAAVVCPEQCRSWWWQLMATRAAFSRHELTANIGSMLTTRRYLAIRLQLSTMCVSRGMLQSHLVLIRSLLYLWQLRYRQQRGAKQRYKSVVPEDQLGLPDASQPAPLRTALMRLAWMNPEAKQMLLAISCLKRASVVAALEWWKAVVQVELLLTDY
jgi:hypothetical protein